LDFIYTCFWLPAIVSRSGKAGGDEPGYMQTASRKKVSIRQCQGNASIRY